MTHVNREHCIFLGGLLLIMLLGECEEFKAIIDTLNPHVILTKIQLTQIGLGLKEERLIAPTISLELPSTNAATYNNSRTRKEQRLAFISDNKTDLNDEDPIRNFYLKDRFVSSNK